MNTKSFANKVAIVTGASSGIGASTAIKLTLEGAKVAIIGRNETKLKNVSEKCEKLGVKPLTIVADMSKDVDVQRIVSETLKFFGKIDILVNNAGMGGSANILDDKLMEIYDKIMATNLRGPVYLTHLAAKHLAKTKGNIVNVSSVVSLTVLDNNSAYGTSKAGLDHFTRAAALDLSAHGVRVNSVNPGPVRTDFLDNAGIPKEGQDLFIENIKHITALKRVSDPDELADIIVFLASDKARGITGSVMVVDNGFYLKPATMPGGKTFALE